MPVEMEPVYSGWIAAIGYDPDTKELHVQYQRGGGTIYNVPPEMALDILQAPSIGEALHAWVRGKFEHRNTKGAG